MAYTPPPPPPCVCQPGAPPVNVKGSKMASLADALGNVDLAGSPPAEGAGAQVVHTLCDALTTAFATATTIALDIEGVRLSRHGEVSIVQVATPEQCFLIDVLGKTPTDPLVAWLRGLLEDTAIIKVIHDCRMDADALHHLLSIDLTNVHDTSCWHATLTGSVDKNLNDTLRANGIAPNENRNKSVYRTNPRFWATRPLTPSMVAWASGDVKSMFALHRRQMERAHGLSEHQQRGAKIATDNFLSWKAADVSFVTVRNPGRFIGSGGCNMRSLQHRTATIIYSAPASMSSGRKSFMVYHRDSSSLLKVQRAAAK